MLVHGSFLSLARFDRRVATLMFAVLFSCAPSACDGGGGKSELAELGVDDGYSKGISTSAQVDGSRDVRLSLKSGALVDVPAGAVTKEVKISIERPEDSKAVKLVENLKAPGRIVSAPYVLTPHGTTFKEDVKVTLPISKESNKSLSVAWLADEQDTQWKLLGLPKTNGEKATISLKHFSVLLLVEGEEDLEPMSGGAPDVEGDGPDGGVSTIDEGAPDGGAGAPDLDGGEPTVRDASVARVDAAMAPIDGGPSGGAIYPRLLQCGLVEREGVFREPHVYGPYERCYVDCLSRATCEELRLQVCEDGWDPDGGFATGVEACFEACVPPPITCADQSTGLRCDGTQDCFDGSDESDCGDLYFQCSAGERVLSEYRCDGIEDCLNGQDELECPHHLCASTGVSLPPDSVCDGFDDCGDGSDEPPTCAILVCDVTSLPVGADTTATQAVVADAGPR